MADLAKGVGFDLLKNPNPAYKLVPHDGCADCCCECNIEQVSVCAATDEDYGEIVSQRSIQVDVAVTASVPTASSTAISTACGGSPSIICPVGINGTYVLTPVAIASVPAVCGAAYYKFIHSELNCHRTFIEPQTICLLTWLSIRVRGFFPYLGTLPFNVVIVNIQTCAAWVDDDVISTLDREGFSDADLFADSADILGLIASNQMHPVSGGVLDMDLVRTYEKKYEGSPFPYFSVHRFVPSAKCRPVCNEVVQVGPVDWVDVNAIDTIGIQSHEGCLYSGGTITAVQI